MEDRHSASMGIHGIASRALRRLTNSKRRNLESTSRTEDGSGEENKAVREDSESTARTDNSSEEENEVLRRDSESTLRTDDVLGEESLDGNFKANAKVKKLTRLLNRMWIREKALNLLERKERNEDVEALSLMFIGHNFTREDLACLPRLRFLRVKESDFFGNFENLLLELRWLSWQTWQMTFHANNFHFSNLVVLDLSNSNIGDDWGGWSEMKMERLKVLDLTGCIQLRKTPDFSEFKTLETLILSRCVKLTTIDGSICKLKCLKTLNIKGCRCLRELPAEFGSLESLTEIIMPQNFQPFKLQETFGKLESLSGLILDEHPEISKLPDSIGQLVNLTHLSLRGCVGIKELPASIGDMEMLVELDLSKSGVVELPDCVGKLKKLRVMRISFTKIRKFPPTIGQVEMLEELRAKKCWDLIEENLEEIGKLFHLRILDLSYTSVSRFPMVLGCLSRLQTLELGSNCLQDVPDLPSNLTHLHMQASHFPFIPDLSSLVSLKYLELSRLIALEKAHVPIRTVNPLEKQLIHPLPFGLSTLKFSGISEIPPLSNLTELSIMWVIEYPMSDFSVSQDIMHLKELKLSKCKYLKNINGLSLLKNLERLYLSSLERLIEIQDLAELQSLLYLRIFHCNRIYMLPNLSKLDKLQHIELDACAKIRAIEGVKGLESLELDDRGCTVLERMLDVSTPTWLSRKVPMYDVFLSFRGPDTRNRIVDFIYKNLVRNRILVFMDDDEFSSGDGIPRELELALTDSYIYIPFLSKNYASSRWCLHELACMVESTSKSNGKKRILPIFYDVEIDDVKLKSNLYRRDLEEHRGRHGEEVLKWEEALKEVADIKGFDLKSNSLEEVIELVTEEVLREWVSANMTRPEAAEDSGSL
ncbi:hypothetical protein NL676_034194 [Syzygium grande]|nr:hypothetical protein NL676_034194 [Syzygium grande]